MSIWRDDITNFGMDSRGNTNTRTLYPMEKIIIVKKLNDSYSTIKKAGKGNKTHFLVRNSSIAED